MPVLRFDAVSKTYAGPHNALNDISFAVEAGEMLFVTGHSGAGKSTLLKLIHLSERATRGTVLVNDRNLAKVRGRQVAFHRRQVGVVHQDHHLLMDRSVFDNVALPLLIEGVPSKEIGKRVRVTLEKVSLASKEKTRPSELSSGEQQRVGIARALISQPLLLLADEPTGNLDTASSREIMDILEQLNRVDGITIILVTHEPDIAAYASRELVMKDGQIVQDVRRAPHLSGVT